MKIDALLLNEKDNVVTCIRDIKEGETVNYRFAGGYKSITALCSVPFCHKIALCDIKQGDDVIKYGESIGKATEDILAGKIADHNNIVSVPRRYEDEYIKEL